MIAAFAAIILAQAAEPTGRIRICREPQVTELMDHHSVPIPAGSGFSDAADPKTGDPIGPPFNVVTTSDVTLPPKPACVEAPAKLTENPFGFLPTTAYPARLPSQLTIPGLSVRAKIIQDFH